MREMQLIDVRKFCEMIVTRCPELRGFALGVAREDEIPYGGALAAILESVATYARREAPHWEADVSSPEYAAIEPCGNGY